MSTNKLKVVLDTNVLLVSISSKSQYHWIFKELLNGSYVLYITNDILMEYEEFISRKFNSNVAKNLTRTLILLPNVNMVNVYYNWNLITEDEDDNKFADCAVACNADFIVTHDKHFRVLSNIEFPTVTILDIQSFKKHV